MSTQNIPLLYRKSKWLELPILRINFHGPEAVQTIKVLLYTLIFRHCNLHKYLNTSICLCLRNTV